MTTPRPTAREVAAEAVPVDHLRTPAGLTDLPHGIYARAVRLHIDPLWGLAGDEPGLFAQLEDAVRDAGLSEHEPPMAVLGAVERAEDEADHHLNLGSTYTMRRLIEAAHMGFPGRCDECGEPHDLDGPTCDCADEDEDADDTETPTSATA
ncbi:hypothetical protein FBZ83_12641 [Azospirillum brasilense]|uniref:Uncharacterized protein n=1 Tax=Azospirillum brasilense TaxID=192 RepID=A0A560BMZ1_AZOBR|nr:hypothetical protein [Azospirillum brasilense]TWA73974.1 hypothetical protein FBZ83_12641 [Azospirillum brasilense]